MPQVYQIKYVEYMTHQTSDWFALKYWQAVFRLQLNQGLRGLTIEMSRSSSLLMPTDNLSAVGSIDLVCRDRHTENFTAHPHLQAHSRFP